MIPPRLVGAGRSSLRKRPGLCCPAGCKQPFPPALFDGERPGGGGKSFTWCNWHSQKC